MIIWSYIGLIAVIYVCIRFIKKLGNSIPIIELILLISGLQWIVGAFIEYRTSFQHYKYYMYVTEFTYMSYVVPAYLALVFFMIFTAKKVNKFDFSVIQIHSYSRFGIVILIIGIFSDIIRSSVPESLQFLLLLLANFKYIGAIILFFSNKKKHKYIFYASLLYLVIISLRGGFFHDLILWSTFFYMFWAFKKNFKIRKNILIIIIGFFLSTAIQAAKSEYRQLIWNGYSGSYSMLFVEIINKKISGGLAENVDQQSELNVRLNQGWIISAIMYYTPRIQSYANGETIEEAVYASLLPRFLDPNKKIAGGVENFEKYTGISLEENTSMGMSLVGEGYANFGIFGGIIFMGVWGFLLGKCWVYLIKRINKDNVLVFFLPLIFLQVVKAETELVVVLNHLVKATILVLLFLWFSKKILHINYKNA